MSYPGFQIGQKITFTTDSDLYNDIYQSEIVAVYPDRLELALTLHNGYLLLVPIGTRIKLLDTDQAGNLSGQVLSRQPSKQTWSITIPTKETKQKKTKVIAVGSGKGGVGKTTLAINLSIALSQLEQRVVLLDADIGMANVELLLKINSRKNLTNVIKGDCTLQEIITEGPSGVRIIPGSSGISDLTNLDKVQFNRVISGFASIEEESDFLIIDTGAGISEVVLKFLEASDDILLITTTEPHALMDTYALTKALVYRNPDIKPMLIINRCENEQEALKCSEIFNKAASKFLELKPELVGWLFDDRRVSKSLKNQKPLLLSHPGIDYSLQINNLAHKLIGNKPLTQNSSGIVSFINRLKRNLS